MTAKTSVSNLTDPGASIDQVVGWALDICGDTYGDERERLRWYEGMTAAAQLQLIALPWAATVLVLALGRPAVLPVSVLLGIVYLTALMSLLYVRRRGVETTPARWSRSRIVFAVLGGLPYLLFVFSSIWVFRDPGTKVGSTMVGAFVGAGIGLVAAIIGNVRETRRRRAQEAADQPDVD